MLKLRFNILIVSLSVIFLACSNDDSVGQMTDTIKLSREVVSFDKKAASDTVTTQGNNWIFGSVIDNGVEIRFPVGKDDVKTTEYITDWIEVRKINEKKISIDIAENTTGKEQHFKLYLCSFGSAYVSVLNVIQKP